MLHLWVEENIKHLTDRKPSNGSVHTVCDCELQKSENDFKLLFFSWSPTSRSRVWTQRVFSGYLEPPPESRSDRRAADDARVCYFCNHYVIVTYLLVCVFPRQSATNWNTSFMKACFHGRVSNSMTPRVCWSCSSGSCRTLCWPSNTSTPSSLCWVSPTPGHGSDASLCVRHNPVRWSLKG